ncbi:ChbG/HpnK family deacetylase [uncultured Faecalicoccus sp.]|uniref:ChbG/HpnK family deacetylase n=1 Tax=uncultured Faecalicoccus sp. TaxID=1971760 RepID=UPI0025853699|nr:ChbG/HpnK family deacetylase [uncultured Faecalicoccus sp.]
MKLIVNADDFGKTHESNLGVLKAFQKGYCSQTSIIVNTNYFDEAVQFAKENNLLDKVGLHINLFEGTPLSGKIKKLKHYSRYDMFDYRPNFFRKYFAKDILAIREELEAQIQKYMSAGFTLMNIDSHHCAFYDMSVLQALIPLLKKYEFQSMRFIGNSYFNGSFFRDVYGKRWMKKIDTLHLKHPDYSSSVATFQKNMKIKNKDLLNADIAEIYIHPVLIGDYLIDDYTGGNHIAETFKEAGLDTKKLLKINDIC